MYIPSRSKILESIQVISIRLSIIEDALKQPISQARRELALTTKAELTAKLSRLEADLVHSEVAEVTKKSVRNPPQVPDAAKIESISEHLAPVPYSDWFRERRVLLNEALEDRKGIVSLPATTFESRTIFPEDFAIKGTLKKERIPWELEEIAKAERSAEEARIIEEAKRLYTKVGGRLEEDDFWEPYIREGKVRYKLAFFRTKEGGIAYAGDNPKIMLESRLSQAAFETSLAEASLYDSEKIKQRIAERAKAYDKEQYDSDTILSNRGLPVKDADKLRKETEQFERDFVINFMVNHPDQLKPWLEAADPKTIKYLNDVLGGEEVLRRKWLPQIEFQGKLFEIGKKRDLGGDTLTDIGVSPAKIRNAVEGISPDKSVNTVIYMVDKDVPKDPQEYAAFVEKLRIGKETYLAKLGEEIDEQVQRKPEIGLGMSVSTDILDLLNPKDVPKGIQISSPVAKANNIQVVKYVPPLRSTAEYKPLHEAWKEGMEAITRQTEAIKAKYPGAVQGRIIRINNAPLRFGAVQEGVVLTDDGKEIQFVTYSKDNPPILAKNQRYTLKNPAETIEGSGTIARVTKDNIEEANFPSQQISTRGIVLDVFDINDPKGTAQYGHLISPVDGKIIKFTTFSRDNPPALERGRMYTIYNSFLQGFQTDAGKFELNINIKPENLYPEKVALTQEQRSLIEDVRASTYKSVIHPTDYKPFEGTPPKPLKTSPVSDPAVATTIENGEVIVITKSGRRIPGKEYQKEYSLLKPKEKVGVVHDEKTLNQIEDENPLDEDQLFMMGLLPLGAFGIGPIVLPGDQAGKGLKPAIQVSGELDSPVATGSVLEDLKTLGSIWNTKLAEMDKRIKARAAPAPEAGNIRKAVSNAVYEVEQLPANVLDLLGGVLYPLSYPSQALAGVISGEGAMSGIKKEKEVAIEAGIMRPEDTFWGWNNPGTALEGFAVNLATDPVNWVGTGLASKAARLREINMAKLWQAARSGMPEFLKNDAGTIGFVGRESLTSEEVLLQNQMAEMIANIRSKRTGTTVTAEDVLKEVNPGTAEEQAWQQFQQMEGSLHFSQVLEPQAFKPDYSDARLVSKVRREEYEKAASRRRQLLKSLEGITDDSEFSRVYNEALEANKVALSYESVLTRKEAAAEQNAMFSLIHELPGAVRNRIDKLHLSQMGWTQADIDAWYQGLSALNNPLTEPIEKAITQGSPEASIIVPRTLEPSLQQTRGVEEVVDDLTDEPTTTKDVWKKLFRLKQAIAKKEAEEPHVNWKKAGLSALAVGTGVSATAIGLAAMLDEEQQEEIKKYQSSLSVSNVTETPTPAPQEVEDPSALAQLWGTAMGVRQEVMSSPLGPTVSGGWDALMYVMDKLQIFSYAEGGLLKTAQTIWDNPTDWNKWKFYGYQWKMTPADVLGVYDPDDPISLRTVAGLAVDIGLDPLTYLTLGSSASVKIGSSGLGRIALNPKGIKALKQLSQVHGKKTAENIFADMLLDPRFLKQVQAAEGLSLRGWGPFFGGHEYELISKPTLETIAHAPKGTWDRTLRAMATSGNTRLEREAERLLGMQRFVGGKVDWTKDWLGRQFVPFYELGKIPRPRTLAPREPEFAERLMRFKHTVRFRTQELTRRMEFLRDQSKTELGDEYKEVIARYLENPVLRESADLSPRTLDILEEMETLQKGFAEAEKARGLLDTEIEGYLKHMLSEDAKKYLKDNHLTSTEVFMPLRGDLKSARMRGYRGSIEEINKLSQEKFGFDLFERDPFKAVAVRGAESFHAAETYDLLEYVTKHYGSKVTEVSDPAKLAFTKHTPQLMNLLPPEVSSELLGDAKDILKKIEPAKEYRTSTGDKFLASDVLRLAAENKLVREELAFQAAKEVVEGEFGKKIVAANPTQEEIARIAVLIDQLQKGVPEEQAVEYARTSLRNVEIPIAIRDILEPAVKETTGLDTALQFYDRRLLTPWKWLQTVPFPAYHSGNIIGGAWNGVVLGETNPLSTLDALRIAYAKHPEWKLRKEIFKPLLGTKEEDRIITTALGETYTYDELYNAAGNLGVFGQPGIMDVEQRLDITRTFVEDPGLKTKAAQIAWKVDPANVARSEENIMRLSMFVDRVKKGDTLDDAARYATKYMFDYLPEAKTAFQRNVLARMFPFFTWQWNNILLQSEHIVTHPGKYAAFGKTADALMGSEEEQEWATGYLPWLVDNSSTGTGKFAYMRTPIEDLTFFNNPSMYSAQALVPFVKAPAEAWAGESFFTGREFKDPITEATLENFPGRPYSTYKMLTSPNKTPEEKAWKGLFTVGSAKTQTELTLEEQFKLASRRRNDFTWQQRFEGWKRDQKASLLSGIPWELQGGHVLAVAEGGLPTMENFATMTAEENAEQTASQLFRLGLPEKEFKQGEFWEEMKTKEETRLEERTEEVAEKLEKQGKWVNDAVKEKIEYDTRKAINIQLYSRELAKIRMQLDWATRRLRAEQRSLAEKQKIPGFAGDKWSERQIKALEWFIPKYQAQYEAVQLLREQERAKEFDLPEQIIRGEEYSKAMLGREREVVIRGKGPALANPDQIKNMVKYEEIALDRAVILGDLAVMDLPKYVPKHIRDQVKKPAGQEWAFLQERGGWYARAIWGEEEALGIPPEPVITPAATPAMIITPTPKPGKPTQTPVQPEVRTVPAPRWNVTEAPSFEEAYGLLLPPEKIDIEKASDSLSGQEMARSDFLESDEFVSAVQGIVMDFLDRGNER